MEQESVGMWSGTNRPPSSDKPFKIAWEAVTRFLLSLVLLYNISIVIDHAFLFDVFLTRPLSYHIFITCSTRLMKRTHDAHRKKAWSVFCQTI